MLRAGLSIRCCLHILEGKIARYRTKGVQSARTDGLISVVAVFAINAVSIPWAGVARSEALGIFSAVCLAVEVTGHGALGLR